MKKNYFSFRTTRTVLMVLLMGFLLLASSIARTQEVSIYTDKDDYFPGEWVIITGHNWIPGDEITLSLTHIDPNIPDHEHDSWTVIADENGDIFYEWYVDVIELNTTFLLEAISISNPLMKAETTFTDSQIYSISIISSPPNSFLIIGAGFGAGNGVSPYKIYFGNYGPYDLYWGATDQFTGLIPDIPPGNYRIRILNDQGTVLDKNSVIYFTIGPGPEAGCTTLPNALCKNAEIYLDEDGNASLTVDDVNNGSTAECGLFAISVSHNSFTCADLGSNTVTLTVTDINGSTATCNATVSVGDNIAPVLNKAPEALIVQCFDDVPEMISLDWTDNCSAGGSVEGIDGELNAGACGGTITRTWNVNDGSGNPAETRTQIITVKDEIAPVLDEAPVAVSVSCIDEVPDMISLTWTDNCLAGGSVEGVDGELDDGACGGTITRTWNISDDCGNLAETRTQIITVKDEIAPVFDEAPVAVSVSCIDEVPDMISLTWTDNCLAGGSVEGVDGGLDGGACGGTITRTWNISDDCGNPAETRTQIITVDDNTPPTPVCKDIPNIILDEYGHASIAEDAVNKGSSDNCTAAGELIFDTDITEFDCTNLGPNDVVLTVFDGCGNSATCESVVTVYAPTSIIAYTSAPNARMFDHINLWAEVKNICTDQPLSGIVDFYFTKGSAPNLSDVPVGSAEAFMIPFNEPGNGNTLRAVLEYKLTMQQTVGYWTVWAVFKPIEGLYYLESKDVTPFTIWPRKASPFNASYGFYTGDILAWTTGPESSTATVTLATTIKDSNYPEGDVRAARVTFTLDGKPIPSAQNLPVGLIDMTDGTVGIASADIQLNVGSNEETSTYIIGVIIFGGYYNQPDATATVVTVSKPIAGGSIMGAGKYIEPVNSAGLIKGADTYVTSFSFDIKYNKKQTNPQGKMTFIIKSWYNGQGILDGADEPHTYIVKTNAINLFVLGPQKSVLAANQAIFDAKANLSELKNGAVTTVDGNSSLHVTLTDNGPIFTKPDLIGVTYFRSAGGLWYSSSWDAVKQVTNELPVYQGDIVVSSATTKSGTIDSELTTDVIPVFEYSDLKVYPNPFSDRLKFEFVSPESVHAKIDVYDMTGRMVQTVFDNTVDGGVMYNASFKPEKVVSAMYFYRMTLGDAVYNGKVVFKKE